MKRWCSAVLCSISTSPHSIVIGGNIGICHHITSVACRHFAFDFVDAQFRFTGCNERTFINHLYFRASHRRRQQRRRRRAESDSCQFFLRLRFFLDARKSMCQTYLRLTELTDGDRMYIERYGKYRSQFVFLRRFFPSFVLFQRCSNFKCSPKDYYCY